MDKETDKEKANEQIRKSNFKKIHFDPTSLHIQKVKQFSKKCVRKGELSKEWASFIVNPNAQPGKNSTLYKTHKPNIRVRLLTTRCNTSIENLAIFVVKHCAKLTENMPTKINDSYHLIDIFETLNASGIPDNAILVSFDIVNMFPSIDNNRGVAAVKNALDSQTNLSPSTECTIEALEICLTNNN